MLVNQNTGCFGNSLDDYNNCAGAFGFTWNDTSAAAPTAVTIQFQIGINCTGNDLRTTTLNGVPSGNYTNGPGMCNCTPNPYPAAVTINAPIGPYVVNGANTFMVTNPASCEGFSLNGGNLPANEYGQVTVVSNQPNINLGNDINNCGACGNKCGNNANACVGGVCKCGANAACGNGLSCQNGNCVQASKLLVIGAPGGGAAWQADVVAKLQGTGAFSAVDSWIDSTCADNQGTPTLAFMQQHNYILVYSDCGFADTNTLGNQLVTFWQAGGKVSIATFANSWDPTVIGIGGAWGNIANGFMTINPVGQQSPGGSLGTKNVPNSPILNGVNALTSTAAYTGVGGPINGATVVASWTFNTPLVVSQVLMGRNRCDLDFYPPSSTVRGDFWSGDGATLMKNCLLYNQ
jgi:hypothetical protein